MAPGLVLFSVVCLVASAVVGSVCAARGTPGSPAAAPALAYDIEDYDQFSAVVGPVSGATEAAPAPTAGADVQTLSYATEAPTKRIPGAMLGDSKVDQATLDKIAEWTPTTIQFMKDHPELVPVSAPQMAEIEELVKDQSQLMAIARGVADYLPTQIVQTHFPSETGA
ncbi:hypothetical protein H6P81_011643 [Aristolochia fimbriata]|uniref:Uncharacterized protein n=1 Tax=Aristolochia fimbriata TaxID=158543 RepID=A0AAV7E9H7_ARIFI|nr:hypothetical protein H6P81_011643 [Aristolochia fimbriata]